MLSARQRTSIWPLSPPICQALPSGKPIGVQDGNGGYEVGMKCLYCQGKLVPKKTNYAASRKGYHLIIEVPAWVCEQCGEPLFDEKTVDTIQEILRSVEVRLTSLPMPAAA